MSQNGTFSFMSGDATHAKLEYQMQCCVMNSGVAWRMTSDSLPSVESDREDTGPSVINPNKETVVTVASPYMVKTTKTDQNNVKLSTLSVRNAAKCIILHHSASLAKQLLLKLPNLKRRKRLPQQEACLASCQQ